MKKLSASQTVNGIPTYIFLVEIICVIIRIGSTLTAPIIIPGEMLMRLVAPTNKPTSTNRANRVRVHSAGEALKTSKVKSVKP